MNNKLWNFNFFRDGWLHKYFLASSLRIIDVLNTIVGIASLSQSLIKALNFKRVTIRVFEKEVIYLIFSVVSWRFRNFYTLFQQAFMPAIYVIADEGQDNAFFVWHFKVCTESEIAICAGFVDTANALISHERELENFFVKLSDGFQVAGVKEGDCLVEKHEVKKGAIHLLECITPFA